MCFSASASFVAGVTLSAAGVATLKQAKRKTEIPFALMPLLFGIQQITEGVIWLTLRQDAPPLKQTMTYVYSIFSHVLFSSISTSDIEGGGDFPKSRRLP